MHGLGPDLIRCRPGPSLVTQAGLERAFKRRVAGLKPRGRLTAAHKESRDRSAVQNAPRPWRSRSRRALSMAPTRNISSTKSASRPVAGPSAGCVWSCVCRVPRLVVHAVPRACNGRRGHAMHNAFQPARERARRKPARGKPACPSWRGACGSARPFLQNGIVRRRDVVRQRARRACRPCATAPCPDALAAAGAAFLLAAPVVALTWPRRAARPRPCQGRVSRSRSSMCSAWRFCLTVGFGFVAAGHDVLTQNNMRGKTRKGTAGSATRSSWACPRSGPASRRCP